nr:zygote arrest protein 1-like [Biomphalaria glabrata]
MFPRRGNGNLRRMYGYFRCPDCRKQWESSHVYGKPGERGAAYGQECKDCRIMCMPYRLENIKCSQCGQTDCECERRHVDPNKNHRSDLCGKCKAGLKCGFRRN